MANYSSTEHSFLERFGLTNLLRLREAAKMHFNEFESHDRDTFGSDPFKYDLLLVIGSECISRPSFYEYHAFEDLDPEEFRLWCLENADLGNHDGSVPNYLALYTGAYNPFIPGAPSTEEAYQ